MPDNLKRVAVIMDYQNIHLTAHDHFAGETEPWESLIHPLHFGNHVVSTRNHRTEELARKNGGGTPTPGRLEAVRVFRGLPSNKHEPKKYSRSQAQKSEWERDKRVEVVYRPLKYDFDVAGDLTGVREKGVDVLVALNLIQACVSGLYDVVILAAHDTDQEPALEFGAALSPVTSGRVKLETAGWKDCKRLAVRSQTLWHTFVDETSFNACVDRRDYS